MQRRRLPTVLRDPPSGPVAELAVDDQERPVGPEAPEPLPGGTGGRACDEPERWAGAKWLDEEGADVDGAHRGGSPSSCAVLSVDAWSFDQLFGSPMRSR